MDIKELMQKLQEPFLPEEIEWRVGSTNADKTKGLALAYVTNRAIQNRLDELFGLFGWKNEYREWKGKGQLCGISVKFEGEWITKWDGADDSNMEATKGGLSGAMKRAACQWGIGRYLYKLDSVWVAIKPAGKSYALAETPKLPLWALPEGYQYPSGAGQKRGQGTNPQPPSSNPPESQNKPDTSDLKCAEEDCGVPITQGNYTVSINKFGRPLCPKCQDKAKKQQTGS